MANPRIPKTLPKKPTKRSLESAEKTAAHYRSALAEARAKVYKRPLDKALQACRVKYAADKAGEAENYLRLVRAALEGEDIPPAWLKPEPPRAPSQIVKRLTSNQRLAIVYLSELGYLIPARKRNTYTWPSATLVALANEGLVRKEKITLPEKPGKQIVYKLTPKGTMIRKLLT
jgi:hypothetical protein